MSDFETRMTEVGQEFDKFIELPGSEDWIKAQIMGQTLEERFPNEDPCNLLTAIECNFGDVPQSFNTEQILQLKMIQEGANDESYWIWKLTERNTGQWYVLASCDYTGWDCQSWLTFQRLDPNQQ